MENHHTANNSQTSRLTRLGELMARAGARQLRAREITKQNTQPQDIELASPIEQFFQTYPDLSISELMDVAGLRRTTAHRELIKLVEQGVLERRGQGPASRYYRI